MKVEVSQIKQLLISGVPGLDPVRVTVENYQPGQGRMTITCWGRAWTAAWFGMSGKTIEQFVTEAHPEYVLSNLTVNMAATLKRYKRHEDDYLIRIIKAVQGAFRAQLAPGRSDA
jgi:hypothetical protein